MSDPVLDPTALDATNAARETMAMLVMNSNNKGGGGVDDLFISSSTWHHAHTFQSQDAPIHAVQRRRRPTCSGQGHENFNAGHMDCRRRSRRGHNTEPIGLVTTDAEEVARTALPLELRQASDVPHVQCQVDGRVFCTGAQRVQAHFFGLEPHDLRRVARHRVQSNRCESEPLFKLCSSRGGSMAAWPMAAFMVRCWCSMNWCARSPRRTCWLVTHWSAWVAQRAIQ